MSVHAHRVIRIVHEPYESFNNHNKRFMNYLVPLGMSGCGMMEFHINVIKGAIKKAKELGLDTDTIDTLKDDVAETEKAGGEYIKYECC